PPPHPAGGNDRGHVHLWRLTTFGQTTIIDAQPTSTPSRTISRTWFASARTASRPSETCTGGGGVTTTSAGHTISRPFRITRLLPVMLIGTIGIAAPTASTNDP